MTYEKMRQSLLDTMNREPEPFIEIYPLAWKKIPEVNEICEARIKNGLGMWSTPIDENAEWLITEPKPNPEAE